MSKFGNEQMSMTVNLTMWVRWPFANFLINLIC